MKCSVEVCQGIKDLIIKIKDKSFSIKTQYKFLKLAKALDSELGVVNEQKQMLLDKYAQKNENGEYETTENGGIKVEPDKLQEFLAAIDEIDAMQIELPDISFTLEELDSLELSLGEIYYLENFIED